MDDEKVIRDRETGEEQSIEELRTEYDRLKNAGETEAETFGDYIKNITEPNGTCEWLSEDWHMCEWCEEVYPESELQEEIDLGWLCPTCILAIRSRGEELYLKA